MDYLTGVLKAIVNKKLSSEINFRGISKKNLIIFMVAMATRLDTIFDNIGIRYIVITFYIVSEGISIIENAGLLGLPIPDKIKNVLESLQNTKTDK